jgi:hypothetical protein
MAYDNEVEPFNLHFRSLNEFYYQHLGFSEGAESSLYITFIIVVATVATVMVTSLTRGLTLPMNRERNSANTRIWDISITYSKLFSVHEF